MTNSQAGQPAMIPKTKPEAKNRMTLAKAIKAAAGPFKPKGKITGFVFDPTASIAEVCKDIMDYAHSNVVHNAISMSSIKDPRALGSNVRADLTLDGNLGVILRSMKNKVALGMSRIKAQEVAIILIDMGRGKYMVVDGNHRYYAMLELGWDVIPHAAILPFRFFEDNDIDIEIFQCDCNPMPERAGMRLEELLERVETNWKGTMINSNKKRALEWIKIRNLGAFGDETIQRRLNGIASRIKAADKAAKTLKKNKGANPHKPNFFNWTGGKNDFDRAKSFNTHKWIETNDKNILSGNCEYYSFNSSDGSMKDKILGTFERDLAEAGTSLKDITIGEYTGNPVKRAKYVAILNVKVPTTKTETALLATRKNALERLLKSITSGGYPFDEIYFLYQAAGAEDCKKLILAWTAANGKTNDFK